MEDLGRKLDYEIRRARFDIHLPQANLEFMDDWLDNKKVSAKKRDLHSLDKALHPGAYGVSSLIEEITHQKHYIEDICKKYGEDDPEVVAILEKHDIDQIMELAETIEEIAALPKEVKQRAENLATFWESEGVELDAFEWLEVAIRVTQGEEVRDILAEYGYKVGEECDKEEDNGDYEDKDYEDYDNSNDT